MNVNVIETLIEFECPKCKARNRTSADEFLMAIDGYDSLRCVACGKFRVALVVLPDRVDEQRNAPVQSEQKCPACDGTGTSYPNGPEPEMCERCDGTGISTRSDGG